MFNKRLLSAAVLLPIVIALFAVGGWAYRGLIFIVMLLASCEFVQLFRRKDYQLSLPFVVLIVLAWKVTGVPPFQGCDTSVYFLPIVTVLILMLTLWELLQTQRDGSRSNPVEQWALTLAGGSYLGIGGARLLQLRTLPDGLWWTLTVCGVVWISETAAYLCGKQWGRHKMAPSISPGKSWEGYSAQIISGLIAGPLLVWVWSLFSTIPIQDFTLTPGRGLLLGGIISALCPAGDFFVSMIKREVDVKDASDLIPGHGGVLDRIDSILWAAILGHLIIHLILLAS